MSANVVPTSKASYFSARRHYSSLASFTLLSRCSSFLREFLTIASMAFGILFAVLLILRDVSAQFLTTTCEGLEISISELLLLVVTVTALVLCIFSSMTALACYLTRPPSLSLREADVEEKRALLGENRHKKTASKSMYMGC